MVAVLCLIADSASFAQNSAPQKGSSTQPENAAASFRVAGTVVSKTDGRPLASARILLASVKNRQQRETVMTSDDGKFEFNRVPAGKYALTGTHRGFISGNYDQHDQFASAIVTGAGVDTENLVLKLAPAAVISGRVLDEVGEPIRNANVTLYYDDHQEGVHQIHAASGGQTDDLGAFDLASLNPGTYFLSVSAEPWYAVHAPYELNRSQPMVDPSLDVTYPVTYYPDVIDPESATPISIRGGEHLQLDLHLNPVPSIHLIVHVPHATGEHQPVPYPQLEQPVFGDAVPTQNRGTRMVSPGTWEITGIPPGRYNLRVMGPSSGFQISGVDLTGSTQELEATSGETLCRVKLSLVRPDGDPAQLNVGLRANNRFLPGFLRPDSKGEVSFENVSPGRYEVMVFGSGRQYSVAQVSAEGAEVVGHSVVLVPGASASLSVVATLGGAEVQGIAKRAGKGFSGAMIVLVPKNPAGYRDLFRRDQSDLDGTFVFHDVVPGSYTVVAIENGWDLDWSQPEVIASYAKHGVPLQIADQAGQNLTLPSAVEVQPK